MFTKDFTFSDSLTAAGFLDTVRSMFAFGVAHGSIDCWNASQVRIAFDDESTLACIESYADVSQCIADCC